MGIPAKFELFLSKLENVRELKPETSWSACCPAHDDTDPSLSVTINAAGNLMVRCHSGSHHCTAPEIVKTLGLTMSDLFANHKEGFEGRGKRTVRPRPDVVHVYEYEDGKLAYETCRYSNPKDFLQRRPNPAWKPGGSEGRYVWNLDGVRLILYRLPRLIAELDKQPERWVTLVEGEKCSDSLEALGILATTHALGAEHWRREYATDSPLRGKRVAIFYDLDPYNERTKKRPGPAWAVQAARDLWAVGCQVRICLPPGGEVGSKWDIADYVLANRSRHPDALKREIFDVISNTSDYYPGWEYATAYEAVQYGHRFKLGLDGPGDMNAVMLATHRKLVAAMDGVSLNSLPSDMAELAAWCQWLAELLNPKLKKLNIFLAQYAPGEVEKKTAQNSEPSSECQSGEGKEDESQEAATTENPAQALCLPAQSTPQTKAEVPRTEDGEPEVI